MIDSNIHRKKRKIMSEKVADDEWEWYIGQLFARIIQKVYRGKNEIAVEIAPGYRYKIAYALKEVDFKGDLYVIDTNKEVLDYVQEKYKNLLPEVNIICINKSFEKCFDDVPNTIDLLLSNHSIDDMIIAEYMENCYTKNLGNEDFKDLLSSAWIALGKDEIQKVRITSHIIENFKNFFLKKKIQTIIISQYKSNLYFKDKFTEMDEITENCFKQIKALVNMDNSYIDEILKYYPFGDDKRYLGNYLLNNTQNSKNWIVGKSGI